MKSPKGFIGIAAAIVIGAILFGGTAYIAKLSEDVHQLQDTTQKVGAFRPSGYTGKLMTRLVEGGSETTFNTTPGTTPDGQSLTSVALGDFIVLTINPGGANEEKISASAVSLSGTTATWTIVSRGLSFASPTTTLSTNKKQHAIGEPVIISNDDQFLATQYLDIDSTQNVVGLKTFNTVLPTSNLLATTAQQFITKTQLDSSVNQGAATSTESNGGIVELGTLAEQASSYDGGAAKPTVLQTKNATSTCQVPGTYTLVASSTTGKLDGRCLDTSSNAYTWSQPQTLSASTTLAATTSIQASDLNTAPLRLNGQSYAFPSSQGASSTALTKDGSGNLYWDFQTNRALVADGASYGSTANSSTTVYTLVLPVGTLGPTDGLKIEALTLSPSNGVKSWDIQFGTGSASSTLAGYAVDDGTANSVGQFNVILYNQTAATQKYKSFSYYDGTTVLPRGGALTINTAVQTYLSFRVRNVDNDGDSVQFTGITVTKLSD